jgi:hypothetical protein
MPGISTGSSKPLRPSEKITWFGGAPFRTCLSNLRPKLWIEITVAQM